MIKVRVLRPAVVAEVEYKTGDVLVVKDGMAAWLIDLGIVAVVTATPAPKFYQDRMMRTT